MSFIVPTGTRLTYVAKYSITTFGRLDPSDALSKISADLRNNEEIYVEDSSYSGPSFAYGQNVVEVFTLKVLDNSNGHGNQTDGRIDIKNIIDHYFYTNVGSIPNASSIQSVIFPGANVPQGTGAPDPDTSTPDDNGQPKPSWWDNLFGGFFGKAEYATVGVAVGAIVAIGLLGFALAKAD